jgi:hypothetical protein
MINKIIKMLSSRTVITGVIVVAMNVVSLLSGVVQPEVLALMNTVLGALAVYFRVNTSVKL